MALLRTGSWGTPELGITEKIGSLFGANRTDQGGSNIRGSIQSIPQSQQNLQAQQNLFSNQSAQASKYVPPVSKNINNGGNSGQVLGQSTGNGFDFTSSVLRPDANLGGGGSPIDAINNEFNSFNSYLDTQESSANTGFNDAKGLFDTQKTNMETQYATDKTNQTEGIKKTESLNLAKVRQLLGELQQGNAARTAISGGGSISEVLGERFGREAQSRLGNVMDQTQQAITRVNDFYNNAITKLNEIYQSSILQAKQTLDDNLSQIRLARTQSASAKQAQTVDAWRGYYDNLNQAKIQAANFKMQYDMWKGQQDQAYAEAEKYSRENAGTFNEGLSNSYGPLAMAPTLNQNPNPYSQNTIYRPSKKTTQDENVWQ
jgi:hypothetical protein